MGDHATDLKRVLWAVAAGLALNAAVSGFVAYESHQANLHATEANRILAGRDFDKIYAEHAELKAALCEAHPELKEKCGGVR